MAKVNFTSNTSEWSYRRGLVAACLAVLAGLCPRITWADGGIPLTMREAGGYRIAVFAEPVPLRAGPVDISVMVQDAQSGVHLPDAAIEVKVQSVGPVVVRRSATATEEAATNKLFKSALLELPLAGRWQVHVTVDGQHGRAEVTADMEVGKALSRWQRMWGWFAWPAVPIGLFLLHQWLLARHERRRARPAVAA